MIFSFFFMCFLLKNGVSLFHLRGKCNLLNAHEISNTKLSLILTVRQPLNTGCSFSGFLLLAAPAVCINLSLWPIIIFHLSFHYLLCMRQRQSSCPSYGYELNIGSCDAWSRVIGVDPLTEWHIAERKLVTLEAKNIEIMPCCEIYESLKQAL